MDREHNSNCAFKEAAPRIALDENNLVDWAIPVLNGNFLCYILSKSIRYIGPLDVKDKDRYTFNNLYSEIQDIWDKPELMDYANPISAQTPTEYTLVNGWRMRKNDMKYLRKGKLKIHKE